MRQSDSSQNAHRSASEPPPRQTTATSTDGCSARPRSADAIAGAARRSCTGASAHTSVPRQPRRSSPASRSWHGGAAARGDDADRLRQQRPVELLLRAEQAVGLELLAKRGEPGEQVALAGEAQVGDAERERGGRGGAARVVVEPAADHHAGAVDQHRVVEPEPVEVREPHRAGDRALGVAQLEVGGLPRLAKARDLAHDEHLRPLPEEPAQVLRVAADRERPGQVRVERLVVERRGVEELSDRPRVARGAAISRGPPGRRPSPPRPRRTVPARRSSTPGHSAPGPERSGPRGPRR